MTIEAVRETLPGALFVSYVRSRKLVWKGYEVSIERTSDASADLDELFRLLCLGLQRQGIL